MMEKKPRFTKHPLYRLASVIKLTKQPCKTAGFLVQKRARPRKPVKFVHGVTGAALSQNLTSESMSASYYFNYSTDPLILEIARILLSATCK